MILNKKNFISQQIDNLQINNKTKYFSVYIKMFCQPNSINDEEPNMYNSKKPSI